MCGHLHVQLHVSQGTDCSKLFSFLIFSTSNFTLLSSIRVAIKSKFACSALAL